MGIPLTRRLRISKIKQSLSSSESLLFSAYFKHNHAGDIMPNCLIIELRKK